MKKGFLKSFIISLLVFSIFFVFIGSRISSLENLRKDKNTFYDANKKIESWEDEEEVLFLIAAIDHFNLSDALMLCKANFQTGEIDLISIPRDARVEVNGKLDKINHAHSKGGIDLSLETIRDFLNIEVDHYVRVDFKAVKSIIDAVGGVEMDIEKDMYYEDTTEGKELFIDIKKGPQVLDGDKAIEFLRYRNYPDGDEGRVRAQQEFMSEFIKQSLRLRNISKMTDILEVYYQYVDTNMEFPGMIKSLKIMSKLDREKIQTQTIPGEGAYVGRTSYFIVDEEKTKAMVENILGDYVKKN